MTNRKPTQVTTGEVRISYEHLLKPYAPQGSTDEKYSVTLLIPKTDAATKQRIDAAIQAAIAEGTTGKWNGVRPPQPPIPIHDGDGVKENGEAFGAECKGCWVITASSKERQEVVDLSLSPIINSTEVYSGMYAYVFINLFPYNFNGKKGVGCGLGPVQKTRDGEPLGGFVSAASAFGAPAVPVYAPQQPTYTPPTPAYAPQQPTYASAGTPSIDPLTGRPYVGQIAGI